MGVVIAGAHKMVENKKAASGRLNNSNFIA